MPRPRKMKSLAVEKWRAGSSPRAGGEGRGRVRRSDPTHDGGAVMDGAPRFVALDGAAKDGAPTPSEVPVGSGVARLSMASSLAGILLSSGTREIGRAHV